MSVSIHYSNTTDCLSLLKKTLDATKTQKHFFTYKSLIVLVTLFLKCASYVLETP